MKVKEVLGIRRYKAGYEVREELIDDSEYGGNGFTKKTAYTPGGHYIGDSKWAYRLCKKWGIKPELAYPDKNVCVIGFCEREKKWYGWSHRALWGFGVGDSVKKEHCAYTPSDPDEMIHELKGQYSSDYYVNVKYDVIDRDDGKAVRVTYDTEHTEDPVPQPDDPSIAVGYDAVMDMLHPDQSETYALGRGEWTAKTLADARLMAIDFASCVG